jgi:DNA-directed RNA polymerase subunit RPC12/RpoP
MEAMSKVSCIKCSSKILRETYDRNSGLCAPCKKKADKEQHLKEHMAKPGCPSCDGKGFIDFNWEFANEREDNEISKYPKYLQFESDLRIGQLYYCPYCEQRWFLDGEEKWISIVPSDRLQYIEKWNSKSLQFSDAELVQLKAIGATPPDLYGNGKEVISIPCEVTDKSGNVYKKAMIRFQSRPPIDDWQKNWHFSDEIESFRASDLCLNQNVRVASSQSKEIRMGFAPTKVQDPKGNQYLLNWTTNFFDYKGVKGKEIVLSEMVTKEMPPIVSEAAFDIEYFIADYSKDLEFLYIGSGNQNSSNE